MPSFGDTRLPDRFWNKVVVVAEASTYPGPCWIWIAAADKHGYGRYGRPTRLSHRVAWLALKGHTDLVLDHLCRVTSCVNPEHLEPVTQKTNVLRGKGNHTKTHCPQGHEYTPENTRMDRGRRTCIECNKIKCRERYQRRKND